MSNDPMCGVRFEAGQLSEDNWCVDCVRGNSATCREVLAGLSEKDAK